MTEKGRKPELAIPVLRLWGSILLVVITGLIGFVIWNDYQYERSNARIRAHTSARVVATHFSWVLEASAQALKRIEEVVNRNDRFQESAHITNISEAVQDLPIGYQYSIYDANGELTRSSIKNPKEINVSDRNYFKALKSGAELFISPMLLERLSNQQVFVVARRLDKGGTMLGVATIAIPMTELSSLSQSLGFAGQSTLGLIRTDGILIARSPAIESMDLSNSRIFEELKTKNDGTYGSTLSPADGVERIVGFWKLDNWPVVALVGLDQKAAMKKFWRMLTILLVIGFPLLLAMVYLILRLLRLMKLDEERQLALVQANKRNIFLLREIHHRVKNNLQMVTSLIRLQKMPDLDKKSLMSRIAAMVAVHEEMYSTDRFEQVKVSPYLQRLVQDISKAFGQKASITFDIAPISLSGDRAMQLGLLVNELVSNAMKHAWKGQSEPTLTIRLVESQDEMIVLTVADNGMGIGEDAGNHMGSKLITAFTGQLGGTRQVSHENGTKIEVTFPLNYGEAMD